MLLSNELAALANRANVPEFTKEAVNSGMKKFMVIFTFKANRGTDSCALSLMAQDVQSAIEGAADYVIRNNKPSTPLCVESALEV